MRALLSRVLCAAFDHACWVRGGLIYCTRAGCEFSRALPDVERCYCTIANPHTEAPLDPSWHWVVALTAPRSGPWRPAWFFPACEAD